MAECPPKGSDKGGPPSCDGIRVKGNTETNVGGQVSSELDPPEMELEYKRGRWVEGGAPATPL